MAYLIFFFLAGDRVHNEDYIYGSPSLEKVWETLIYAIRFLALSHGVVVVVEDDAETSLGLFEHCGDRVAGHRRPRGRATAAVRVPVVRHVTVAVVGLVERQPTSWVVVVVLLRRLRQRVVMVQLMVRRVLLLLLLLMVVLLLLLVVVLVPATAVRRHRRRGT